VYSTRVARHINAGRAAVYGALLNPQAVARWRAPDGMSCEVHEFDGREGGAFRVSLSCDSPDGIGKSSAHTDTYPDGVPSADNEAGTRMALANLARLVEPSDGAPAGDPYGLARFVSAQDADGTYRAAVAELRAGRKRTHWMWFVFPQLAGLGHSSTAQRFAISSLAEAGAYLRHRVLGPRLLECSGIVAEAQGRTAEEIFGPVDAMKLRSSVTLFMRAAPEELSFPRILERYFAGIPDPATDRLL
jgi:uncharacterized protein (DUF1810 family)